MKIVVLSGWAGSGKDVSASYLTSEYGFVRVAFADLLKDAVSRAHMFPREWCDDRAKKEAPLLHLPASPRDAFAHTVHEQCMKGELATGYWTPRALCILEGSMRRAVDPDYWVKKAVAGMKQGGLYVISDARFKNEMVALRRGCGQVTAVRINRFATTSSVNPSERDLDDYAFDHVIENKGTQEALFAALDTLAVGLL